MIPVDAFGRVIDPRNCETVDPSVLASVRPTLEPLALTPLRNAAVKSAWGRGKIDLPPGIAKKLADRPVFVGEEPVKRRGRDFAQRALRVERVPDKVKEEKFKVRDDRGNAPVTSGKPEDVARKQQIDRLAGEAAKGNREAEQADARAPTAAAKVASRAATRRTRKQCNSHKVNA